MDIDLSKVNHISGLSINLDHGIDLQMVYVPGGSFIMGAPLTEAGSYNNERPQHQVTLQPFYMSKYPISQQQYQALQHHNPAKFRGENRPVEQVDWHEARSFCDRLIDLTGLFFALPSEAQWEYACRAGTTTPFYFGATISSELANFDATKTPDVPDVREIPRQQTSDVGIFPPNAFGLYDMHGNVWEWCLDTRYGDYQGAPTDGSAWEQEPIHGDPRDDEILSIRGGSWRSPPRDCRSAASDTLRYCNKRCDLGFRVVINLPIGKAVIVYRESVPTKLPKSLSIREVVPIEDPLLDPDTTAWLEYELLQLVLSEMNLPLETSLEDLLQLDNLPQLTIPDPSYWEVDRAEDLCDDCWLFESLSRIAKLVPQPIQQLAEIVLALIWQDALEKAIARELAFSGNLVDEDGVGFLDPAVDLRESIADEKWEAWQALDGLSFVAVIEDFLDRYK